MVLNAPDWLLPGSAMPWPVSAPFRMRPNLARLNEGEAGLLLLDDRAPAYRRERERLLNEDLIRCSVGEAHPAILEAIAGLQAEQGLSAGARHDPASVALSMQEDFVILCQQDNRLLTEYLSVCFPSRWDPREKLGLDFAAIHAPVADNAMLLAAGPAIMQMAFQREPMLRHVWLIVPSPELDQHPQRNENAWRAVLSDPAPLLPRLYWRVERQTTWPLPQHRRAVFFIRVLMSPLSEVLNAKPVRAQELLAALASMSPAVLAYRGMQEAMPRLLAELQALA